MITKLTKLLDRQFVKAVGKSDFGSFELSWRYFPNQYMSTIVFNLHIRQYYPKISSFITYSLFWNQLARHWVPKVAQCALPKGLSRTGIVPIVNIVLTWLSLCVKPVYNYFLLYIIQVVYFDMFCWFSIDFSSSSRLITDIHRQIHTD